MKFNEKNTIIKLNLNWVLIIGLWEYILNIFKLSIKKKFMKFYNFITYPKIPFYIICFIEYTKNNFPYSNLGFYVNTR